MIILGRTCWPYFGFIVLLKYDVIVAKIGLICLIHNGTMNGWDRSCFSWIYVFRYFPFLSYISIILSLYFAGKPDLINSATLFISGNFSRDSHFLVFATFSTWISSEGVLIFQQIVKTWRNCNFLTNLAWKAAKEF